MLSDTRVFYRSLIPSFPFIYGGGWGDFLGMRAFPREKQSHPCTHRISKSCLFSVCLSHSLWNKLILVTFFLDSSSLRGFLRCSLFLSPDLSAIRKVQFLFSFSRISPTTRSPCRNPFLASSNTQNVSTFCLFARLL